MCHFLTLTVTGVCFVFLGSNAIFYQATPAVGADGQNIIKLVPVQTVNRQLPQSHINDTKRYPGPQKAAATNVDSVPVQTVKMDAVRPSAAQQLKQLSLRSQSTNVAPVIIGNTPSKDSLLKRPLNSTANVPQVAAPAANCKTTAGPQMKLLVTAQSPALPPGQTCKLLSNTPLQTVLVSKPLQDIKKTVTPSVSSTVRPGPHSVASASPITSVHQGQRDPVPHSLSTTQNKSPYELPVKSPNQRLKLVPKESQRPNSPIKWTVMEEDSLDVSDAPPLKPLRPDVETQILRTVAHKENDTSLSVSTKPAAPLSQIEVGSTLLVCDGKVFYVQRKGSAAPPAEQGAVPIAAAKTYEFNKVIKPSQQQSAESSEAEIRRVIISSEDCEVIDLCDDSAPAAPPPEEDNVIFVSYVAPKSDSTSDKDLTPQSKTESEKETAQTSSSGSDSVTQQQHQNNLDAVIEERPGHNTAGSTAERVSDSGVEKVLHDDGSDVNSQPSVGSSNIQVSHSLKETVVNIITGLIKRKK